MIGFKLYQWLKALYEHKEHSQDQYPYSIELDCGEIINVKGFANQQTTNKIKTSHYTLSNAFLKIPYNNFTRFGNLVFLLLLILIYIQSTYMYPLTYISPFSNLSPLYNLIPLLVQTIIFAFKEIFYDRIKSQQDLTINKRRVTVFKKLKKTIQIENQLDISISKKQHSQTSKKTHIFEQRTWQELEVGDLIFLKRNEAAPADLLILDCPVQISCLLTEGKINQVNKYPSQLTQYISQIIDQKNSKVKCSGFDYKKILTGFIKYKVVDNGIQGFIKINKDLKGDTFNDNNILYRESVLKSSQYAYAIVLFAGMNSWIYKGEQKERSSFFRSKSKMFFALTIASCLLQTLSNNILKTSWIANYFRLNQKLTARQFFIYFFQYFQILPIYIYLILDLVELMHSIYHSRNYSDQSSENRTVKFQQLNSANLADMVMSEYICFDKTGTLTSGYQKLSVILIDDKAYKFNQKRIRPLDFKAIDLNQIEENDEEDLAYLSPQGRPSRAKQTFRLSLNPGMYLNKSSDHNYTQIQPPASDDNLIENLRMEDLNDSHCKITEELRNKPKPFFNKEQSQLNPFESPNVSVSPQMPLCQESMNRSDSEHLKKQQIQQEYKKVYESEQLIHYLNEQDFHENFQSNRKLYMEALISLAVCHRTKTYFSPLEDSFYQDSHCSDDQILYQFASSWGVKFICSNLSQGQVNYLIEIDGEVNEIQIITCGTAEKKSVALYEVSNQISRNFQMEKQAVLVVRDETFSIPSYVEMDKYAKEYWDKVLSSVRQEGLRSLLYSSKNVSKAEREEVEQWMAESSKKSKEEQYEVLRRYEKDMQIIQVIGMKEKLKEKKQRQLVQNLKDASLKVWVLSGDELSRVVSVAYNTSILEEQYRIVQFDDPNELGVQIKGFLQAMNKDIQKKLEKSRKKPDLDEGNEFHLIKSKSMRSSTQLQRDKKHGNYFAIIITGECFKYLEQDVNLFNHFCFIAYFSKCLIGCCLSKHQKASLIRLIQKKFPGNKKVIAVGDGYNDIDMLNIADTGMLIEQEFKPHKTGQNYQRRASKLRSIINQQNDNPLKRTFTFQKVGVLPTAQYKIPNLLSLVNLLFYEARYWAELMDDFLVICFYRALLIGYMRFLWNFAFAGDEIALQQNSVVMLYQSVCLFSILLFNVFLKFRNQQQSVEMYKYQFKSNIKIFKKKKILSFLFKINGNAFIDATIIVLSMISLSTYLEFDRQLQIILIQELFAYDVMRVIYHTNSILKYNVLLVCLYVVYLAMFFLISLSPEEYMNMVVFLEHPEVGLNVGFTLLVSTVINKTMEYCVAQFLSPELVHEKHEFEEILSMVGVRKKNKKRKLHNYIKSITVMVGKLFQTKDQLDISIQEMISGENKQITRDKINPLTLQFQVKDNEIKYKRLMKQNWIKFDMVQHLLSYILLEIALVGFNLIQKAHFDLFILMMSLSAVFQLFISGIVFSSKYIKHFFTINLAVVILRATFKFLADLLAKHHNSPSILLTQTFSQIICFTRVHFPIANFSLAFLQNLSFIVYKTQTSDSQYFILNSIAISLTTLIMVSTIQYKISYLEKEDFLLENTLNLETQQINNVLAILLPKFIRDRIDIDGKYNIAQKHDNVAILFCDICNFDNIISVEQSNIINLLDTLFRKFDSLCMVNHLQKIETVGKTYMAACLDKNQNQVKQALNLAINMKEFVSNQKFGQIGEITIKIGIHYGSVIAGVIGDHKPQFSLIGDTVNTTSRVCSTGQDGEITLSNEAYLQIESQKIPFKCIEVEAKGKGTLLTYQLLKNQRQVKGKKRGGVNFNKTRKLPQEEVEQRQVIVHNDRIKEIQKRRMQVSYNIIKEGSMSKESGQQLRSKNLLSNNNFEKMESRISKDEVQDRNMQQHLENKLERDVVIEQLEDNPEFEVEMDKIRTQFLIQNEDIGDSSSLLKLNSRYLYLDFQKSDLKQEFQQKISKQAANHTQVILYLTTFIYFLKSGTLLLVDNQSMLVGRIIISSLFSIFSILQTKKVKMFYKEWYFIVAYSILIFSNVAESLMSVQFIEIQGSEATLLLSFFCSIQMIEMKKKVMITIVVFFFQLAIYGVIYENPQIIYFIALQCSIELIFQYVFFTGQMNTFNRTLILKKKKFQSDKLLKYLLPSHILGQFLSNSQRMVLAEEFEEATLLFADIAGFTAYSSQNDPETVVNMLRNLFTEFDRYCLCKNVYKLYTIGDCYVILGIVDAGQRKPAEEAKNVIEMGLIMREVIVKVRREINFDGLDMRIGIHTVSGNPPILKGKIICGILGTDIVRYDVYGEDVMISNKMESNGIKGRIQVSEETKKLIEQEYPYDFNFEFNKEIDFKSTRRKTRGYLVDPVLIESNHEPEECQFE